MNWNELHNRSPIFNPYWSCKVLVDFEFQDQLLHNVDKWQVQCKRGDIRKVLQLCLLIHLHICLFQCENRYVHQRSGEWLFSVYHLLCFVERKDPLPIHHILCHILFRELFVFNYLLFVHNRKELQFQIHFINNHLARLLVCHTISNYLLFELSSVHVVQTVWNEN